MGIGHHIMRFSKSLGSLKDQLKRRDVAQQRTVPGEGCLFGDWRDPASLCFGTLVVLHHQAAWAQGPWRVDSANPVHIHAPDSHLFAVQSSSEFTDLANGDSHIMVIGCDGERISYY